MIRRSRAIVPFLFVLLFASLASAQATLPPGVDAPPNAIAQGLLDSIPSENIPLPHLHYYRSNEWRHDVWAPHINGLGGAYVGVGSDQNYTLAAMARSEMLFLVDYDGRIPTVHAVYEALVVASETPQDLVAKFAAENERSSIEIIRRHHASDPDVERIVRHYTSHRDEWHRYVTRLSRLSEDGHRYTWLGDPTLYAWVRKLHQNGRIVSRTGDLTGSETVRNIGRVARALGLTIRIYYMSNAEQFFEYTPGFVENMRSLPIDDRSVVLRTIRHRSIPNVDRWHYMTHDARDFAERLETGAYRRSFALVADLLSAGPPTLGTQVSRMTRSTPRAFLEDIRERRAAQQ